MPLRRRRLRGPRGFTIIELLVVVAVITLLVTILAPSLRQARSLARRVNCATVMREWCVASLAYQSDYQLHLPGWVRSPFCPLTELIEAGRAHAGMLRCPEGWRSRSFSASAYICYRGWRKTRDVEMPHQTLFIVEEDETSIDNEHWAVRRSGSPPMLEWWNMIAARHLPRGANLTFMDGHVEYWTWQDPKTGVFTGHYVYDPDNVDLDRLNRAQCPPYVP
mgnify:CR=1 FL=1